MTDKVEIAIQTGMQLIPYVGGSLATAYFGTKQAKQFKRIEDFYQKLAVELEQTKTLIAKMESQYVDGLVSLVEQVNNKVENEHLQKKAEYLRKYMINLLKNPVTHSNYDVRKVYLDNLGNMTLLECEIITDLYQQRNNMITVGSIRKQGVKQYAIVGAVSRIKSYGFLKTTQASFSIGATNDDNMLHENIAINDYGIEFVKYCLL